METDYLIVGAGLQGLAFASELVAHSNATIILLDRRARVGGHWNSSYPFVRLHQPSIAYGVGVLSLGRDRIEPSGVNAGLLEQASGEEVLVHFERVLTEHLLPSGRVRFLPKHEYVGTLDSGHEAKSLVTGQTLHFDVSKRLVDTTLLDTKTPTTHTPNFEFAQNTPICTPAELPEALNRQPHICVLGGGKTAMDVVVWLRQLGFPNVQISWVRPRDSWLINRETAQPGSSGVVRMTESYANKLRASATAADVKHLYETLEELGEFFRIDPNVFPEMNHGATISRGELELLREVQKVYRHGHVRSIEPGRLEFDGMSERVPDGTLFVDCTARSIAYAPSIPVFEPGKITTQIIREGLVSLSAAATGFIEATFDDDDDIKNRFCRPMGYSEEQISWPRAFLREVEAQAVWSSSRELRNWMKNNRLTNFGSPEGDEAKARMVSLRTAIGETRQSAVDNLRKLVTA